MQEEGYIFQKILNTMKIKILIFLIILTSCAPLKQSEKVSLDDPDMGFGTDPGKSFENYTHSIREGAKEPASEKGSGGCGCN